MFSLIRIFLNNGKNPTKVGYTILILYKYILLFVIKIGIKVILTDLLKKSITRQKQLVMEHSKP
jgi:hypothetical protein